MQYILQLILCVVRSFLHGYALLPYGFLARRRRLAWATSTSGRARQAPLSKTFA